MYSVIFILEIKNPESRYAEKYIIDYNGNKTGREIRKDVEMFIKKHKYFQSEEFTEECLNDYSSIYYMEDLDTIKVII